jgi:hypothetical protein
MPATVIFPPWWSHEASFQAAARAGVEIMSTGSLPNVVVVSAGTTAGLVNLYRAGAWGLIRSTGPADCGALLDLARSLIKRGEVG